MYMLLKHGEQSQLLHKTHMIFPLSNDRHPLLYSLTPPLRPTLLTLRQRRLLTCSIIPLRKLHLMLLLAVRTYRFVQHVVGIESRLLQSLLLLLLFVGFDAGVDEHGGCLVGSAE